LDRAGEAVSTRSFLQPTRRARASLGRVAAQEGGAMQQQITATPARAASRRRRSWRKRGAPAPPREELLRHVIGWVKQHGGESPHFAADVASILEMLGSGRSTESITSCLSRVEADAPRAGAGRNRVSTG
jgi:hypothetical protein